CTSSTRSVRAGSLTVTYTSTAPSGPRTMPANAPAASARNLASRALASDGNGESSGVAALGVKVRSLRGRRRSIRDPRLGGSEDRPVGHVLYGLGTVPVPRALRDAIGR